MCIFRQQKNKVMGIYSASKIAFEFVKKGIEQGVPVTQMKLQKMVYFAHGIHLALYDKPLIKESFQAWKYGPVVPALYQAYKFYGSNPITDTDLIELLYDIDKEQLDNDSQESINNTWDTLKDINASQLSNWTHNTGSPWETNYVNGSSDINIPNEEIKEYFKKFMNVDTAQAS